MVEKNLVEDGPVVVKQLWNLEPRVKVGEWVFIWSKSNCWLVRTGGTLSCDTLKVDSFWW